MKYQNNPELSELENFYIDNYLEYLTDPMVLDSLIRFETIHDLAKFFIDQGRILHEKHAIMKQ